MGHVAGEEEAGLGVGGLGEEGGDGAPEGVVGEAECLVAAVPAAQLQAVEGVEEPGGASR